MLSIAARLAIICLAAHPILAFTDDQVAQIRQQLIANATKSWELGTAAEALLELEAASLSVYGASSLPRAMTDALPADVMTVVDNIMRNRPSNQTQLVQDGSAADPCSLGVAVLLANASMGSASVDYAGAATQQLNAILYQTPRSSSGAISHRVEQVQLWSDFVYMAPPFIAYYGAMTSNQTLLQISYDQIRLYRDALRDSSGCWAHIIMGNAGSYMDPGLWATGNGWVAAGIMRVYATIGHTSFASSMSSQLSDLSSWTAEILNCAWPQAQSNTSLIRNYVNQPVFADAASSAILASVSYRYAALGLGYDTLDHANAAYMSMSSTLNSSGVLEPVVNPLSYSTELPGGQISPEAQAFALMAHAALRDWQQNNVTNVGANAQPTGFGSARGAAVGLQCSMVAPILIVLLAVLAVR